MLDSSIVAYDYAAEIYLSRLALSEAEVAFVKDFNNEELKKKYKEALEKFKHTLENPTG